MYSRRFDTTASHDIFADVLSTVGGYTFVHSRASSVSSSLEFVRLLLPSSVYCMARWSSACSSWVSTPHAACSCSGGTDPCICMRMAFIFAAVSAVHSCSFSLSVAVGMATANEYLHPDKPVQIWVNEMGVAKSHRRQGIGKKLLHRILALARDRGFGEIWLGTEDDNVAARALYHSAGGKEESFVMYSWEFDQKDGRE